MGTVFVAPLVACIILAEVMHGMGQPRRPSNIPVCQSSWLSWKLLAWFTSYFIRCTFLKKSKMAHRRVKWTKIRALCVYLVCVLVFLTLNMAWWFGALCSKFHHNSKNGSLQSKTDKDLCLICVYGAYVYFSPWTCQVIGVIRYTFKNFAVT